MDMHWFYIGAFADIFIFSLAMAYKIKQLMLRVMEVRQKISRDLHDDIGASLSSLQIYGAIAEETFRQNPEKAVEMIQKISVQSRKVMDDMSDIVWSMKPGGDQAASLETRIKNFGAELLQDKSIQFTYSVAPEADLLIKELQHRRNLLLVIKEAMNNIAKYSQAAIARLKLSVSGNTILLEISDDGRGFDTTKVTKGNGLANMQARVLEMNGEFVLNSAPGKGASIHIKLPIVVNHGW
jgi:signal transduction histidine kinase